MSCDEKLIPFDAFLREEYNGAIVVHINSDFWKLWIRYYHIHLLVRSNHHSSILYHTYTNTMSGDNNPAAKTVQTLLAPIKGDNNESSEKPSKVNKRSHSEVSEESVEGIDLMNIHQDLKEIKECLKGTLSKSDLENAVSSLVKQSDLTSIVSNIVKQLLIDFEEKMVKNFQIKLIERTGKLQDQIDSLSMANEDLKESVRAKEKAISILEEQIKDSKIKSSEALQLANYNEQYSRKHNIRIINFPEKPGENLRKDFIKIVNHDLKVNLEENDIVAIHRIPGKQG